MEYRRFQKLYAPLLKEDKPLVKTYSNSVSFYDLPPATLIEGRRIKGVCIKKLRRAPTVREHTTRRAQFLSERAALQRLTSPSLEMKLKEINVRIPHIVSSDEDTGTLVLERFYGQSTDNEVNTIDRLISEYQKAALVVRQFAKIERRKSDKHFLAETQFFQETLDNLALYESQYGNTREYQEIVRYVRAAANIPVGHYLYSLHGNQSPLTHIREDDQTGILDFNETRSGTLAEEAAIFISNARAAFESRFSVADISRANKHFIEEFKKGLSLGDRRLFMLQLPIYLVMAESKKLFDLKPEGIYHNIKKVYGVSLDDICGRKLDWMVEGKKPTRKRRILHLSHEFETGGGIATYLQQVKPALEAQGDSVDIFVHPTENGFTTSVLHTSGGRKIPCPSEDALLSLVRSRKYDIIHFNMYTTTTVYGFDLKKFIAEAKCPVVYTAHSSVEQEMERMNVTSRAYELARDAQHEILRTADVIGVVSHALGHDIEKRGYLYGKRVRVIPNALQQHPKYNSIIVDRKVAEIREKYAPNGEKLLMFIGRISYEKGVRALARSYEALKTRHNDLRLVFVGDGPLINELKRDILKVDAEGLIADGNGRRYNPFAGFFEQGNYLLAHYAAADAVIIPSRHETFSLSGAQTILMETPLIISDVDGAKENFLDTGFSYPINNPRSEKSILHAVERCLADCGTYQQRQRLKYARDYVSREFSLDNIAARLTAVYDEATERYKKRQRKFSSEDIIAMNASAMDQLARGKYQAATTTLEKVLSHQEATITPWLHFNYAQALLLQGEYKAAASVLVEELRINKAPCVRDQLAYIHTRLGNIKEAEKYRQKE